MIGALRFNPCNLSKPYQNRIKNKNVTDRIKSYGGQPFLECVISHNSNEMQIIRITIFFGYLFQVCVIVIDSSVEIFDFEEQNLYSLV